MTFVAQATEEEREVDYPGGKSAAEVEADAVAGAKAAALASVTRDLVRLGLLTNCAPWEGEACDKIVGTPTASITGALVTWKSIAGGLVVIYAASATASGSITITCECMHGG